MRESSELSLETLGLSELDPQQYQRVQRVRSTRATHWLERPITLPYLTIAAVALEPVERLMLGT